MSNDVKAFRANIDAIVEQYEQLAAENSRLRNENALLKAKISMLQKSQEKLQNPQIHAQTDIVSRQPKKRQKTRLQVEWIPIQYEFSDSVLCTHRYGETVAFGTADANIILFNTNFDSIQSFHNSNDRFKNPLYSSSQIISPFAQYRGHSGAINCITADPATELFASCSGDNTIHVWSCYINNGMFTSQQRHLSTDSDNSTSITNIKSNLILSHHTGPVVSASWLTNGHLLTGSSDSTVCLWDVAHSQNFTHVEQLPAQVICTDAPRCSIPLSNMEKGSSSRLTDSSFPSSSSLNLKSSISPFVGYAVGLSNGEVRFFDVRLNGRIMDVSHSKGQIVSCKFGTFDMNNVTSGEFGNGINDNSAFRTNTSTGNGGGGFSSGSNLPIQSGKKKKKRPSSINILYDVDGSLSPSLNRFDNQSKRYDHNFKNSNNYSLNLNTNREGISLGNSVVSNSSLTNLPKMGNFDDNSSSISGIDGGSDTNLTSYSFVSAGSDKSVRIWDLRMPQDYIKSFGIDHVPTKIDVCGHYICVPTETGNPRFINLAQSVIMPLASPPFSYTVSSCAFASNDGSKTVMASWDGTAAIMQFEMKKV